MKERNIEISNAHMHNLKNIDLTVPKHKLVVFTGVSGSGKSSLLFDTIFTEAQRQLVETFSTFAQTRLPKLTRPDVDEIKNLSTAILIDQKKMGHNMRSTVGTATEILTYLRLLFSRLAEPFIGPSFYFSFNHPEGMCPNCSGLGKKISIDTSKITRPELSLREGAIDHPECRVGGFLWREILMIDLFDPDKKLKDFSEEERHLLFYTEPVPVNKRHGAGTYLKNWEGMIRRLERLKAGRAEKDEGKSEDEDSTWEKIYRYSVCPECEGTRLNARALSVRIMGKNLGDLCRMEISELIPYLKAIESRVAIPILRKALLLLENLEFIGVGYLSLERSVSSLSGGESQRVKTARQLDCDLTDLLYILDEPTVGLHPRDTQKLLELMRKIRDAGNSVLVVEHDPDVIRAAEWIIDVGPKAGIHGGTIVYNGPCQGFPESSGITASFLNAEKKVAPSKVCIGWNEDRFYAVKNAKVHNLKNVDARFPEGMLTCVTGVAGSGKSSLIHECFMKAYPMAILIDQSPIGRTSRGNLATYTGIFDTIRKIFAVSTGHDASDFSFNSGGACPKCSGQGQLTTELFFLDSVKTVCDECGGKRYRQEILDLRHNGKNIDEVLSLTAGQAHDFFDHKKIREQMKLLSEVGLDYVKIGQTLSSLSGGEAQRLKIAAELINTGNIYVMDEPTTGLHLSDMERLYSIIRRLTSTGNTVIVIEHNPDLIKHADWIIDLGPEGGKNGGSVLYEGVPAGLLDCQTSITGIHMKDYWL